LRNRAPPSRSRRGPARAQRPSIRRFARCVRGADRAPTVASNLLLPSLMKKPRQWTFQAFLRVGLLTGCLVAALGGCSSNTSSAPALPADVQSIIFLQRVQRDSDGNVFNYTSFVPGGRLVKLEPPSADGKLTVLTLDPMFDQADIMAWDLSFDAKSVVFSARLADSDRYQIFTMNVDGTNPKQLTDGDNDRVYPIFLPGQQVLFTTNENVEEGTPQFQDEYERQVTAQVATVNLDGSNMKLGPRNVSHRVSPTLLPDGHVLYTEWRHLGMVNDGHLRLMNTDMTGMREAFGGELASTSPQTNSYLRGRYVDTYKTATGQDAFRLVAVATSRDRTLQSGKLFRIDLDKSEALSSAVDLTPKVPGDRVPSTNGVGRYYDAEVVGAPDAGRFIVSWADGPVESEVLAMFNSKANFGLYVYDSNSDTRFPLYDDPAYWDIQARPVKARAEPPVTASPVQGDSFLVSALNVYDSSLSNIDIPAGPRTFGTTEFDGQSLYGEVPVQPSGSFAARVPANVPVHLQVIDKFGIALANEAVWISGRAGEQRTCGGCHESRSITPEIPPGQIEAIQAGAVNLDVPRAQRVSMDFSYGNVRGVPWDKALQPIFDAKCVACHDGDASKPGNPSFTVMDVTSGLTQTFVFDLRGQKLNVTVGEKMTGDFTASYISVMGLGEILGDHMVNIVSGTPFAFGNPADAAGSDIIQRLNPPQRFPAVDTTVRRYPNMAVHPVDVGGTELTPDQYYLLGLSLDMGGQFFSRENKEEATTAVGP
jgi:hypothetical protein